MTNSPASAIQSICVYCGSRDGTKPVYAEMASALGTAIASAGLRLVYGGAQVGLMGALANAALAAGGDVLGVIPHFMTAREIAHPGLPELKVVDTMHQRKLAMIDAADAFIALPGGYGTLEELFEVLTWHQLGWHDKPCGLLDVAGFYAPLLACMQHMHAQGFVAARHLQRICIASEPERLLALLSGAESS